MNIRRESTDRDEVVYQALKEFTSNGGWAYPVQLKDKTLFDLDQIEAALRSLRKKNRIVAEPSPRSTGKDNYGEIITFGKVKAI